METFWTLIPFVVVLLIAINLYETYKNRGKEKIQKLSWIEGQSFFKYLKLVFVTRVNLRPWTAVWYIPLFFATVLSLNLINNIRHSIYPPLPLEKMQTQQGIIQSIIKRKKMDDLLVLKTNSGLREEYAYRLYGSADKYIDQNVTIYYSRGFSSLFSIDNRIYQITTNDTKLILDPYNYIWSLRANKNSWNFTQYCFFIAIFSLFMIWIPNRNELPIHRLNRMKSYKKNKGEK